MAAVIAHRLSKIKHNENENKFNLWMILRWNERIVVVVVVENFQCDFALHFEKETER